MKKNYYFAMTAIILSMMFAGCGGSDKANSSAPEGGVSNTALYQKGASDGNPAANVNAGALGKSADDGNGSNIGSDAAAEALSPTESAGNGSSESTARKLIRTVGISAETEKYDALVSEINSLTVKLGGYIENSSESAAGYYGNNDSGRYLSMTLRIPKDKADKLIKTISDAANITSRTENSEDVTLQYTDIDSHKKALQAEEKRLMDLMEKADKMADIVALEDKLADVRYQIESMESQLRVYDNQVDYTTVNLDITEVKSYSPGKEEGFWQRISTGFMKSLEGVCRGAVEFAVWFISHIPYITVWIVIIFAVIRVCMMIKKRKGLLGKKNRKENKDCQKPVEQGNTHGGMSNDGK